VPISTQKIYRVIHRYMIKPHGKIEPPAAY
jgi:hypothetical protein